jgi:hypothetical protein
MSRQPVDNRFPVGRGLNLAPLICLRRDSRRMTSARDAWPQRNSGSPTRSKCLGSCRPAKSHCAATTYICIRRLGTEVKRDNGWPHRGATTGRLMLLAAISRLVAQSRPPRPWHSPEERQVIGDAQRLQLPTVSVEFSRVYSLTDLIDLAEVHNPQTQAVWESAPAVIFEQVRVVVRRVVTRKLPAQPFTFGVLISLQPIRCPARITFAKCPRQFRHYWFSLAE